MKITKRQLGNFIRKSLIREAEGDRDDGGMYAAWARRQRENPHPHDKETWDEERKRMGKATPTDTSPEAKKMVDDVLAFIEDSNLGTPQQVGDSNRYTVNPVREIEVDFLIQTKKSGLRLVVKILGTRDFVPSGANIDGEDLEFVAENMSKITDVLSALAGSGLPIHSFTVGTMG